MILQIFKPFPKDHDIEIDAFEDDRPILPKFFYMV